MSESQEGRFWRADSAARPPAPLEEIVDCACVNVQQLKGPVLSATESYGNSNSRKPTRRKERSHVPTRT